MRQLRSDLLHRSRSIIQQSPSPIRVIARMVAELEKRCRELNIAEQVLRSEIVNRTIGDVDLRRITECEGESGGPGDYRLLADELGVALPNEQLHGYVATSETYLLYQFRTQAENNFKLASIQLDGILQHAVDVRIIYLPVTNNPTTFAYTAAELTKLFEVLRRYWESGREIHIIADLAYIGTTAPEEDQARLEAFAVTDVFLHTIFVSTFSKSHTLTGERFGWVTIGDPKIAAALRPSWSNTMASLPAEWQLRFMAYVRLIQSRPWIVEKLRAFYKMRRHRLITQLQKIDDEQHLFTKIHLGDDATVYNWSQLRPGEDAFSLFEKTGIAGVPGSGFGYTNDYIRLSIGVIPVPIAE